MFDAGSEGGDISERKTCVCPFSAAEKGLRRLRLLEGVCNRTVGFVLATIPVSVQ